jgi:4-amino-4-deoxy-L-arabinose transferase-like glycosyltransferase
VSLGLAVDTARPSQSPAPAVPLQLTRTVALVFLAAKIALLVTMQPYMDEAYYFLWGQHPALSYFDHPSLIGWTQGVSATLFGWNMAGLREPVFLTLCGDLFVFYLFARRLGGAQWPEHFWLSAALFLTMPIMLALTGVAIPDHLLVLCSLGALYLLFAFLETVDASRPAWIFLYGGATAIGLATLSKYYGVLIGVAFLAALVIVPRYRPLFRSPHLYGAVALALILQAPVVLWNVQNEFASLSFIAAGRVGVTPWWAFSGTPGYLAGIVVVVSPFLVWPTLRLAVAGTAAPLRFPQALMWISTLAFLLASTVTGIIVHWNGLAYVAAVPFLAAYVRSRALFAAHVIYAAIVLVLFAINYSVVPLAAPADSALDRMGWGHASDQAAGWGYGWDQVAAKVAALRDANPGAFLAATDYTIAAELGFATHDRNTTSLSPRLDAFDFWFDPAAHQGQSAIIVTDGWRPLYPEVRAQFVSVEDMGNVAVARFGYPIDQYTLYVARGFARAR